MPPSPSTTQLFKESMRGPTSPPSSLAPWGTKPPSNPPTSLPPASPSASILLISPTNRILLLRRLSTSSTFASATVFPGGHLSPQDGPLPPPSSPAYHQDSIPYRQAAIRECFEESGILLARPSNQNHEAGLLSLPAPEKDQGRKAVHAETIPFTTWLQARGGLADTAALIPFTRWLTPANIPRRFSTQMYLYLLPLLDSNSEEGERHIPTPDGGLENTAAQFLYPDEWLEASLDRGGQVVLFPPQFFLLSLIASFLKAPEAAEPAMETFRRQREELISFVKEDGVPPWGEKCISPDPIRREGGSLIMGMAGAGPEVAGTGRGGDGERVLRVELEGEVERGRQRPRPVGVEWRRDVVEDEGRGGGKL